MYRHNPQTAKLKELVDGGAIGTLRLVRATFSYSLYDADNIRLRTDVEGGALMDVGCYCVSGARLLAGEPDRVWGDAWFGETGTDWVFTGTMRFPNDVLAHFDCGTALQDRDELEVVGSEGSLFLDDPWHANVPVIEVRREDGVERIELEPEDSYRLELENVSDAIRGEGELLLGREDAVAQARVVAALHESATSGQPVALR
jgi:predicted dehydrogenase